MVVPAFLAEAVIKLLGLGPTAYFKSGLNWVSPVLRNQLECAAFPVLFVPEMLLISP